MKIKICGLTSLKDAKFAFENGADLLGFVFYKKSPRYAKPADVKEIIAALPKSAVTVGVFVNETNESMTEIAKFTGLSVLQLHGDEPVEQLRNLGNIDVIKAISLTCMDDLKLIPIYDDFGMLIDSPSDQFGGTGVVGNWDLAQRAALDRDVFLAGGLKPDNIERAIELVRPYGVDVSSGVEIRKGVKDPNKVREFIENARRSSIG